MKNVIVKLRHTDGTTEPLAVGVPGDRDVDLKRLGAQVEPAEVDVFDESDFAANSALVKGYIGPGALGADSASGIRFLVDPRIVDGTRWVTGANEPGRHVIDLTYGRDFTADGVIEAAEVRGGDVCPNCGSDVEIARGIEMGHIFQLGRRYSEALGLQVQDEAGRRVTPTMGSYGIGVSRAVAALAEANHDDIGLIWPHEVSPADVHLVIAGKEGGPQRPAAEELAAEIEAAGLRVLFDDREGVSPGVRFKDAELIGVPTIVVVGRGITDGLVEVKDRRSGARADVPVGDLITHLTSNS
jgi:prolyl-tRNA synthetase